MSENIFQTEKIDNIFSETPMELKKTTENFKFIDKIKKKPIKKNMVVTEIFGVEKVDLNSILMMNIWDRSILTTDSVCRTFFKAIYEQRQKYYPKKTKKSFEYWWLIILLLIGIGAIIIIVLFIIPMLHNIKLF